MAIYTGSSMQIPWYIGWPIVIAFALVILFMVAIRAPYYPIKYPSGFWELQSKLGAEDVWLLTSDGVRLYAWWIMAPQASLVTLYLHGNAGNLTHRFLPIRENTAAGSSVPMLDYRGYGKSEGSPSEHGLYADADAAYLYLLSRPAHREHCALCGVSISRANMIELAQQGRIAAKSGESRARMSASQKRQGAARRGWLPSSLPTWLTQSSYLELILPRLSSVTVPAIARTLNVSEPYAAKVRKGKHVPHPMHWQAIAKLVGVMRTDAATHL